MIFLNLCKVSVPCMLGLLSETNFIYSLYNNDGFEFDSFFQRKYFIGGEGLPSCSSLDFIYIMIDFYSCFLKLTVL